MESESRPRANSSSQARERAGSIVSTLSGPGGKQQNEKINVISEGPGFATFEIKHEDHTLGNALRTAAMTDQRVRAAAYIVPHPLESRMEIRIETVPNEAPAKALKAALNKVAFTCDDFSESFESSLTTFRNRDTMEVEDSRLRQ